MILSEDCKYETPFKKNNNCYEKCSLTELEQKTCKINNTVTQTQWLNNLLQISINDYSYVDIAKTSTGDLLISCSSLPEKNSTMFYGITQNGRPYFKVNNTKTPNLFVDKTSPKYESFSFTFKLNGINDDKEYFMSVPKDASNPVQVFDFDNNIFYEKTAKQFFNLNIISIHGAAININTDGNYYILGVTGITYTKTGQPVYVFNLFKNSFISPDIANNNPIKKLLVLILQKQGW
jgi:hypothetical protein